MSWSIKWQVRGVDATRRSPRRTVCGLETAVQDADEPVGELAQGSVEFDAAGALLLVRSLRTYRVVATFFLPEARVTGLVPA